MNVVRVTATGHRPEKLLLSEHEIIERTMHGLHNIGTTWLYQGMASGFDLLAARAAWMIDIPFACVRPWMTHGPRKGWEDRYEWAMEHAAQVIEIDQATKYPGPWVYDLRNRWMVDHSDKVLAWWNGTPGGTKNCIDYADDKGVFVSYLDTDDNPVQE